MHLAEELTHIYEVTLLFKSQSQNSHQTSLKVLSLHKCRVEGYEEGLTPHAKIGRGKANETND